MKFQAAVESSDQLRLHRAILSKINQHRTVPGKELFRVIHAFKSYSSLKQVTQLKNIIPKETSKLLESKQKYNLECPRKLYFLQVTPSKVIQAANIHTTTNLVIKKLIPTRNKMKIQKKTVIIRQKVKHPTMDSCDYSKNTITIFHKRLLSPGTITKLHQENQLNRTIPTVLLLHEAQYLRYHQICSIKITKIITRKTKPA